MIHYVIRSRRFLEIHICKILVYNKRRRTNCLRNLFCFLEHYKCSAQNNCKKQKRPGGLEIFFYSRSTALKHSNFLVFSSNVLFPGFACWVGQTLGCWCADLAWISSLVDVDVSVHTHLSPYYRFGAQCYCSDEDCGFIVVIFTNRLFFGLSDYVLQVS